jgi:starch-binding outer membrane protein, SusD/RagB family
MNDIFLLLLLCTGLGACNKLLDVQPPPNEVDIDAAFNDSASAVAAVAGIYNQMVSHDNFEWSGASFNTSRSGDDASTNLPNDYFGLNTLVYTDGDILGMWQQGFSSLLMINTCIKGLQSADRLSVSLQHQLLGESFFCRAFVNFYLVNSWGNAIPLITTPDVEKNKFANSVPQQQIYDQIIADLLQAKTLLTNTYPGRGKVRPNVMAANSFLARVYLYQGRYNDAIAQASTVIGSNLYAPLPAANVAFLQNSKEAIWQLMPAVGNDGMGAVEDATLYKNIFTSLSPQLVAAFEFGDQRRQYWVSNYTYLTLTFTTANKYKDKGFWGNTAPTEYYIVLRLAEQYLVRAEAYTRLNQVPAAVADLNVIRNRAGLTALSSSLTQQECMNAVEQERRAELFTEWGHRWFDLKRWPGINNTNVTRADEVLSAIKADWQPTDKWYPVPQAELQLNPSLIQNPGYPAR